MSDKHWNLRNVSLNGAAANRLSDISINVMTGVTAVVGQSGAGKTSLLNNLNSWILLRQKINWCWSLKIQVESGWKYNLTK